MKKILFISLILLVGILIGFNVAVSQRVALAKATLMDASIRLINNPALNQVAKKCKVPSYVFAEQKNMASLIVGHAYGSSKNLNNSIAPNLTKFLIKNSSSFEEIIFTGDVIQTPSTQKWRALKKQMREMGLKIKIAPGNHDVGASNDNAFRDIFFQEFNFNYPYFEKEDGSIFIFMDSTISPGKIDDNVLLFLENAKFLEKNVFIFSHHLLRPQPHLIANGLGDHRLEINNIDILKKSKNNFKKIYLISGDSGLRYQGVDCLQFQNIYFISSGINNSDKDVALILHDGDLFQSKLVD